MAITEESRHRLYQRLEEVLGSEQAATLMEHLPPVGWADVATKRDLDTLRAQLDGRFEGVDARFEAVDARFDAVDARFDAVELRIEASANAVRAEFQRDLRIQAFTLLAGFAAVNSLAVAAVRFV